MTDTAPKQPDSSLKTRLRSAAVFGPAVLLVVYLGGWPFILMMAAAAAIAVDEWAKMVLTDQKPPAFLLRLTMVLAGVAALAAGMLQNPLSGLWLALAFCFLIFCYNFSQKGPSLRRVLGGFVYIVVSIAIMTWLRADTSVHGLYNVATLLLVVWGSDVFAYFAGRTLGGPKLAPNISPKKTWSGFLGGALGAGVIAAGLGHPAFISWVDVDTIGGMEFMTYGIVGFVLGMVGQGGDLLVSHFKRKHGVKDTGTLIPGHGGLLDRIDALLLVAYVFGLIAMVGG